MDMTRLQQPQGMPQTGFLNTSDPKAYAPGQMDNELARIRALQAQGALPPRQGVLPQQGGNGNFDLGRQVQQLQQFISSAPLQRDQHQEIKYQTALVNLRNLMDIQQNQTKFNLAQKEQEFKMQQAQKAQEEAQKMKREAHFEKLRKMGNAQRIAQVASGNNNAGTFTGAGGTESVPVIAGAKTAPLTSSITKHINSKKYDKAMDSIEQRKMMLLNLAATLPTTETSSKVIEYELGQLGKLQTLAVGNQAKEEAAKQLENLQKLKNLGAVEAAKAKQKPNDMGLKYVEGQINELSKLTPQKIEDRAKDTFYENFTKPVERVMQGKNNESVSKTVDVNLVDMNWNEALDHFGPEIAEAAQAWGYEFNPAKGYFFKGNQPLTANQVRDYYIKKYSSQMNQELTENLQGLLKVANPEPAPQQAGMATGGGAVSGERQTGTVSERRQPTTQMRITPEKEGENANKLLESARNAIKSGRTPQEAAALIENQRAILKQRGQTDKSIDWVIKLVKGES